MSYKNYVIHNILLIALLLCTSSKLYTQTFAFRNYTVNDGLPSSEVYHSIQDSKGYIWFATNHGVSRFNGYEFKNYSMEHGLPDNTILDLFEDYKGRIWFMPISLELSYFYNDSIFTFKHNDSIRHYLDYPEIPQKKSFYVDTLDNIFFSIRRNGIVLKISESGIITNIIDSCKYKTGTLEIDNHIIVYKNWKGSLEGFYVGDNKAIGTTSFYDRNGFIIGCKGNEGKIVFANHTSINIIENNNKARHILSPYEIFWISQHSGGNYWIGTEDGFFVSKKLGNETFSRKHLSGLDISSINEDREQNIWITTLSSGIYVILNRNFSVFNQDDSLLNNHVNFMLINDDNLYFSYKSNGLSVYNIKKQKISTINNQITEISSLYKKDSESDIYISNTIGLFKYIKKERKYLSLSAVYKNDHSRIVRLNQLKCIYINNNDMWIGNHRGLCKVHNNIGAYIPKKVRIYDFCAIRDKLYIGSLDGLLVFDLINERIIEHPLAVTARVNDIEKISDNILAIGTKGRGVAIYDIDHDSAIYITGNDGLISNSINRITLSDDTAIWLTTNEGASKIVFSLSNDFHLKDIQNFSTYNGLPTKEIHDIQSYQSNIYMSSSQGLIKGNINKLVKNSTPPPVLIETIRNRSKDLQLHKHYRFNHDENSITLKYAGLSYKNAGNLNYKYRMLGLDDSLQYTKERLIRYASLAPGKYIFQVWAQNEDGVWSTNPASITFQITPPLYKRVWFIISIILITILFLIWIYKYRVREITKKNILLLTINEYKQKLLRQQMNPHFMFNTLNSIQYYLLNEDIDSSLDYLSQFARLMRMILENSQKKYIPIQTELDALEIYLNLEVLRYEQKIDYNIHVDKNINTLERKIPPLLLQPYCENSIKHGLSNKDEGGKLIVAISEIDDKIKCIVEDNGIGRIQSTLLKDGKSKRHRSLGTEISQNRVKILNELYSKDISINVIDLTNNEGLPSGTRIEILLPIL